MEKQLDQWLEQHLEEMVKDAQELFQINTVRTEGQEGAPFGQGVNDGLLHVLELGKKWGFDCENVDHYMGVMDYGQGEDAVGIISHVDVVPEGDGWTKDPYGAVIEDGKIYARGALDNKGPLIAAFYACSAIKALQLPLSKKITHLVGTNEESGFECLFYYLNHRTAPSCGIVPDARFPAVCAEKGLYRYFYQKDFQSLDHQGDIALESIQGGVAYNVVPNEAQATLMVTEQGLQEIKKVYEGYSEKQWIELMEEENHVTVIGKGASAHASLPSEGVSAIAHLVNFLAKLTLANSEHDATIKGLSRLIGEDTDGTGLGVASQDDSGELTVVVGIIEGTEQQLTVKMDMRYPVTLEKEILGKLEQVAAEYGFTMVMEDNNRGYYYPVESEGIQQLMAVYQEVTGDTESQPVTQGSGTYARNLPGFISFGPVMPGVEPIFHKADEYISIDHLLLLSKIYARALYRLAK